MKAKITAALKEAGFSSKLVTVREESSSLDWSFTLTIRDASVNYKKLKDLAESLVSVDRCSTSGEILAGANTYVHVAVSDKVAAIWAGKFKDQVDQALAMIESTLPGCEDSVMGAGIDGRFDLLKEGRDGYRVFDKQEQWTLPMHYCGARRMLFDLFVLTQE